MSLMESFIGLLLIVFLLVSGFFFLKRSESGNFDPEHLKKNLDLFFWKGMFYNRIIWLILVALLFSSVFFDWPFHSAKGISSDAKIWACLILALFVFIACCSWKELKRAKEDVTDEE